MNYSRLLSKSLTVKFNIAMTQRKFKGYETLDEREIDIALKNFYDEKATILGPAISYKTDLFKASADLGYILEEQDKVICFFLTQVFGKQFLSLQIMRSILE